MTTILYAKQSYSAYFICEYPDAYVDPYPALYGRLSQASRQARNMLLGFANRAKGRQKRTISESTRYFQRAAEILDRLQNIAAAEVAREPLRHEDLAFINTMIKSYREGGGCGGPGPMKYDGWYVDLLHGTEVDDPDFTVADVHTGEGQILHVGKGRPRRMVVSVDTAQGPRAFVGAVYSYYEHSAGTRLTDAQWRKQVDKVPDVPWMRELVAHSLSR